MIIRSLYIQLTLHTRNARTQSIVKTFISYQNGVKIRYTPSYSNEIRINAVLSVMVYSMHGFLSLSHILLNITAHKTRPQKSIKLQPYLYTTPNNTQFFRNLKPLLTINKPNEMNLKTLIFPLLTLQNTATCFLQEPLFFP